MVTGSRSAWRRALGTPVGVLGLVIVTALVILAVVAPLLWEDAATTVNTDGLQGGPSEKHILGTDRLGRDVLARVLVATQLSLLLTLAATGIGVVIGVTVGVLPAILGKRAARFTVAAVNFAVAFPSLLLALFVAAIFGAGAEGAVWAIGIATAPSIARLTQNLTASVEGLDFVAAGRIIGIGRLRILRRHVLPNIAEPLIINITLAASGALLAFAGLSFLGLGVQAPLYDWGVLLNEGLDRIYINPAAALAPGVAIVIAGLAFNLLGEAAARVTGQHIPARGMRGLPPAQLALSSQTAQQPGTDAGSRAVLAVRNLTVSFPGQGAWFTPVKGVDLVLNAGESVGIVGESGSGKSLTALAIARLIQHPGHVGASELSFLGESLLNRPDSEVRRLLGTSMAMIFQDSTGSFNPTMRLGHQLGEIATEHHGLTRRRAFARAVERLRSVRLSRAEFRATQHPHELSGGMRQRAMIAMGLMGTPRLIIADEPTTALDVAVQRQVLDLLAEVREHSGAALVLISHDIAVVAEYCDRIAVMYAGRIVEEGTAAEIVRNPRHPYTRALIASVPDMATDRTIPLATIPGRPPQPDAVIAGCAFAARCAFASARCRAELPELEEVQSNHRVACWHPHDGGLLLERERKQHVQ